MHLVEKEIGRIESKLSTRGGGMVFTRGGLASSRAAVLEGLVGETRLADKVAGILTRVERELDAAEGKIGDKLRFLDLDNDGVVRCLPGRSFLGEARERTRRAEMGCRPRAQHGPFARPMSCKRGRCARTAAAAAKPDSSPPSPMHPACQISMEELQSALSFLREQMGEEELRHMLQELSKHAGADGGIDVNKLMELAKRDDHKDK